MFELSNVADTLFVDNDGVIKQYTNAQANELFELLRNWRLSESDEICLPAYCVLDDKTLKFITDILPTSLQMLWIVPGIRGVKIAKYGDDIIEIVQQFLKSNSIAKVLIGKNDFTLTKKNEAIFGFLGLRDYFKRCDPVVDTNEIPTEVEPINYVSAEQVSESINTKETTAEAITAVEQEKIDQNTCKNCMELKNGNCFGQTRICEDFRFSPTISAKERANWPQYGDVTAFKKGERR